MNLQPGYFDMGPDWMNNFLTDWEFSKPCGGLMHFLVDVYIHSHNMYVKQVTNSIFQYYNHGK